MYSLVKVVTKLLAHFEAEQPAHWSHASSNVEILQTQQHYFEENLYYQLWPHNFNNPSSRCFAEFFIMPIKGAFGCHCSKLI